MSQLTFFQENVNDDGSNKIKNGEYIFIPAFFTVPEIDGYDKPYSFSGITLNPEKWTDDLLKIKKKVEDNFHCKFNSVLLNLYQSGNDSISWHTDAEKELGTNPLLPQSIFGLPGSFNFDIKKHEKTIKLMLTHGSLLIMQGELQHFWQHQVPKTRQPVKSRINLTFRL